MLRLSPERIGRIDAELQDILAAGQRIERLAAGRVVIDARSIAKAVRAIQDQLADAGQEASDSAADPS